MVVESIDLQNYRNYDLLNMELDQRTNIIYGDNAQGKTNILEALYVCATTKSHRGSKDREIIRFENEESHIKVVVKKHDIDYRIDMHLKKNKAKGVAVNGIPIHKASELFGIMNIVFFSPEDLNIIKNGPSERRRFIDLELSQLDKIYVHNLIQYNRTLVQRNKLLKDLSFNFHNLDTLDIWDMQLSNFGRHVIEQRRVFIEQLNGIIYDIHRRLSGDKENLTIRYIPSVEEETFADALAKSRERDLKFKLTSYGPHKDDMEFYINDVDVRKYGSQGQQRTAALSLKLAEIELVKKVIQDKPILLLDDVLSELDSNRQNFLLDSIGDIQTIVTCTGLDEFIHNRFAMNKIFKVNSGIVENMN